jgi:hypothetical protein
MPPIARTFVKAAFLYFLAAVSLGALMMLDGWFSFSRWLKAVYLSQLHLLLVGWITQLSIGVAYWIFPRFLKEQDPRPRGPDSVARAVLVCLNTGLLLRFLFEPFYLLGAQAWVTGLLALSGVLQALAVVGFAWLVWGRIRTMES